MHHGPVTPATWPRRDKVMAVPFISPLCFILGCSFNSTISEVTVLNPSHTVQPGKGAWRIQKERGSTLRRGRFYQNGKYSFLIWLFVTELLTHDCVEGYENKSITFCVITTHSFIWWLALNWNAAMEIDCIVNVDQYKNQLFIVNTSAPFFSLHVSLSRSTHHYSLNLLWFSPLGIWVFSYLQ